MKKFIVNILIFMFLWSCNQNKYSITGQDAPKFTLPRVPQGTYSIDDIKGKTVLLHFWADWCASCRAEFPRLQKAYQQLKEQNFEIVAINSGQSPQHVQDFIDEYGITFPMLVDESTEIAKKYQVKGLPMNFFIGPDGSVRKVIIGWVTETQVENIFNDIKTGKI